MVPNQAFGQVRVALLERLDDVHVVDDRAFETTVLGDRAMPDGANMDQDTLGGAPQRLAAGELDDALVEPEVRVRVLVEVGRNATAVEGGKDRSQRGNRRLAGVEGDEPRGHALERRPDDDDFQQLGFGLARDEVSAARHASYERLVL